ncbi:MAG: hypothetical protein EOO62_26050 [Hymenobacter sp.]|nr:MAG: hypothetical protein EOO62_26050 [Hymenobacter sp.]
MSIPIPHLAATPDLSASYNQHGFQPTVWFYTMFGELPRREIYQLVTADARKTVLANLAETYDLDQITVVQSVFMEEVDKDPEWQFYALSPEPHTLLFFSITSSYGDQSAILYYSPRTEAGTLARLRASLQAQLESGQVERQRIQVLRLMGSDLAFSPLPLKIPALDLAANYNDDLLPVHEAIVKRLQKPEQRREQPAQPQRRPAERRLPHPDYLYLQRRPGPHRQGVAAQGPAHCLLRLWAAGTG